MLTGQVTAGEVVRYFGACLVSLAMDLEWGRKDTLAVGLYLLACLLFIGLRRRAYVPGNSRLLVSFSGLAAVSVSILFRQWSVLWIAGLFALLLIGLILREKPITQPIRRQEIFTGMSLMVAMLSTLALLEGALRIAPSLLPEGARLRIHWRSGEDAWYVPHPYIGHLHTTDGHASRRTARPGVETAGMRDAWGFRNHWPWPAQVDIVAVGDSFTYSQMVDDHEAWATLLARHSPTLTVLNLGLIGAAPQQYLRIYETFGVALRPKVLLVGLFLENDLWDARRFQKWWEAGGEGDYPSFGRREASPGITGWMAQKFHELYLVALLQDIEASYRSGRAFSGRTVELAPGERIQLVPSLLAQATASARPERAEFSHILETIERIQAAATQHQTHCIVLFFPSKEEVYLPLLGEDVPDLAEPFLPELRQRHIAYVNLTPLFRERALAKEQLFFEVDGHPNVRGYALIAEAVLTYLRDHAHQLDLNF
jgi:hypothetical protein